MSAGRFLVNPVTYVVFLLLFASAAAGASSGNITLHPSWAVAKPGYGVILYPTLSVPVFTTPGGEITIILADKGEPSLVAIDDGYGHVYNLSFTYSGGRVVAEIPVDAAFGIYDLFVRIDETLYGVPHAVVVADPGMYESIYVFHVTDRHFGVINPNGRTAASYDLAADMIALMMPNNTIVIDTGDIADTANPMEYKDSLVADALLNKPMISIPGNHDHVGGSDNYERYRGLWNFTLSIYGLYRVVGIDSGFEGYIDTQQAAWAANVLTSTPEPVKIVMFHHPHFTHMFGDVQWNFTLASWEDLYNLLLSNKPGTGYRYIYGSWLANEEALKILVKGMYEAAFRRELVLSGHVHLDSYAEVHKPDGSTINYVVTTATGGSVRPGDYHGYRVIKLGSDGSIEFYGRGPMYTRHASFSLEDVDARIVSTSKAVTVLLRLGENASLPPMVERTVIAVPVPAGFIGKQVGVELEGLESYSLRCTPLGCTLYAYSDSPPEPGRLYRATIYTVEDTEPPRIRVVSKTPRTPVVGSPVTIVARLSDDAWGVAYVKATLIYDGNKVELIPSILGSRIKIVVPSINTTEATVVITAVDAAGHVSNKTITIKYKQLKTTTTSTTAATTATATTATATTVATATSPAPAATATTASTTMATTAVTETATGATGTNTATTTVAGRTSSTGMETAASTATPGEAGTLTAGSAAKPATSPAGAGQGQAPVTAIVAAVVVAAVAYLAVMARRR